MQEKERKFYESPRLTVVEFRTERGYAESNLMARTLWLFAATEYGTGDQNIEDRGEASGWEW